MIDIKSYFTKQIDEFLESDLIETEIKYVSLGLVVKYLKSLGFKSVEGIDTNGYQVDYWYYMAKGDMTICLSGCLLYGESINISKN